VRNPEQVVRAFCAEVSSRDASTVRELFHPDAVFHDPPKQPQRGREEVLSGLAAIFTRFEVVTFEIRHLAAAGEVVLTERVDWLGTKERAAPVPVMGTFEIRDGLIHQWRDYFDQNFATALIQGDQPAG